jgi:hypothetical protein
MGHSEHGHEDDGGDKMAREVAAHWHVTREPARRGRTPTASAFGGGAAVLAVLVSESIRRAPLVVRWMDTSLSTPEITPEESRDASSRHRHLLTSKWETLGAMPR